MNWSNQWESEWLSNPWLEVELEIGNLKVPAWQVGDLVVHRFIDNEGKSEDYWQVTHVPTLTRFDKAVPNNAAYQLQRYSKEALLSWCHKVQLEHKDLWAQLRAFTPDNYKSIDDDLLMKIREWCLSVKVE